MGESKPPVHVPSLEELLACVVLKPPKGPEVLTASDMPLVTDEEKSAIKKPASRASLSRDAEAFLRQVAASYGACMPLESHWAALGITSGSIKKRILDELHRAGFIHLEHKGKARSVGIYPEGWNCLGLPPPKMRGRGGDLHRQLAKALERHFKKEGYDCHIEKEIGTIDKKRIDLIAFRGDARIGIEIALGDIEHEIVNLVADLRTGVLDTIIVTGIDVELLCKIRSHWRSMCMRPERASQIQFQVISFNEERE